jgi:hypothetical protein
MRSSVPMIAIQHSLLPNLINSSPSASIDVSSLEINADPSLIMQFIPPDLDVYTLIQQNEPASMRLKGWLHIQV